MSPRHGVSRWLAAFVLAAGTATASAEQEPQATSASGAKPAVQRVVAGKEYDRSGKWRFWFGNGYRKAWTTPVELPVLDLKTEAGGLTPLRQIGGFQTEGLAFKGADGRGYTFRKLEKHPERILPKEWQDSELRAIAFDQTAAAHPAATAIVGSLAQSLGIPFYGSRLAVMPDDPALGEFQKTFGGTVGTLDEYPTPGWKGATEIVSTFDLWKKWREGPANRVDSRAFLKARLFDLVVGNWDRHQGQWRWARMPDDPLWVPLPEDADQAFTRYEGKAMRPVRSVVPRFMRYSGKYPRRIEGLTTNNYDVTRWLLADVEWPVYQEVAREVVAQMTDAAIDQAMHQMPPEWYAIDGAQMTRDLRQRRDGLEAYARKFYLHLADPVDVRATDQADLARIEHLDDGSLRLTLAPRGADGAAGPVYYQRRFLRGETKEIRLYLLAGDDRVEASGTRRDGIHVRVLGQVGADSVDDSKSGGLDVQDWEGHNVVKPGPGTRVSDHEWKNPAPEPDRPWLEPRNYGHWTVPNFLAWWEPNQEVMVGGGFTRTAWGFRKYPWANMHSFTLLYSTGYSNVRASYSGAWRVSDTSTVASLDARFSGVENMNFFGFGNETPKIEDGKLYRTETNEYRVFPALRFQPSARFELHVGPEARVVETKGGDSLVEQQQAYGIGHFGEVAARAGLEFDSRGRSVGMTALRGMAAPDATAAATAAPVSGVRVQAESFFVPKGWDATSNFGGVDGSLSGYVGNEKLVLAARAGGRALWGSYPWFESASISGEAGGTGATGDVRGYYDGRYRGDSSLYGNLALRFWLGHRKRAVLPVRWGLETFCESGRVWFDDESSKKWHTGYGLGLMVQIIGTPMVFTGSMANGTDGIKFYVAGGYSF